MKKELDHGWGSKPDPRWGMALFHCMSFACSPCVTLAQIGVKYSQCLPVGAMACIGFEIGDKIDQLIKVFQKLFFLFVCECHKAFYLVVSGTLTPSPFRSRSWLRRIYSGLSPLGIISADGAAFVELANQGMRLGTFQKAHRCSSF